MSLSKRKKLEDLPDEVILKIFSFLDLKDILRCGQMSKRIRAISNDPTLWLKLNLCGRLVPYEFIEKAIQNGCKYLGMASGELIGGDRMRMPLELKYLDMCNASQDIFLPMLKNCHSLEKLSMEYAWLTLSLYFDYLAQNGQTLKILNLKDGILISKEENDEVESRLLGNALRSCTQLTELNLSNNFIVKESIKEIIVKNVTSNILKLDLSNNEIEDKHVDTLVKRCKRLTELDLRWTSITKLSIDSIVTHLNPTLVKLNVAHTNIQEATELLPLRSMKSLKILLCLNMDESGKEEEIENLRKELFNININDPNIRYGSFGIANSTPNDLTREQGAHKDGFWEIKAKQQELFKSTLIFGDEDFI